MMLQRDKWSYPGVSPGEQDDGQAALERELAEVLGYEEEEMSDIEWEEIPLVAACDLENPETCESCQ